jgi:hypothetical protein
MQDRPSDYLQELERLHALRESGALSEEEFQPAKAKLLERVSSPPPSVASAETFLSTVRPRLVSEGFDCQEDVSFDGNKFPLAARRSRFEVTKFGFAETFFVFDAFPEIDMAGLHSFSDTSFRYALSAKTIPLPRGLFEAVFCFPVAVVPQVQASTGETVRNEAPRRHWSSFEMPVIFETASSTLYYYEKTGVWGAAYFAGFRNLIRTLLTAESASL